MSHHVYILKCADESLYCGSTKDLEKRLHAHNHLNTGAKYTKQRRPVTLVYSETHATVSDALRRELQLKKLTRAKKLALITSTKTT